MTRGRVLAGIAVAVAVALVVVLLLRWGGIPDVRQTIRSAGVWAPIIFVLLQGVITIAPVPRTVFTVAAGVFFGGISGVLLTIAGTVLAAVIAFWLVRVVGGRFVERHSHRAGVMWVRSRLEHRGLLAVISLRLIPAMPFALMNYASGLSGVRLTPYVLGTVLGVLPGTIAIVILGDAAVGGNPPPALFAVSIVSGLVGITGAVLASRRPPVAELEEQECAVEREAEPDRAA